jgi:hypothetical protein
LAEDAGSFVVIALAPPILGYRDTPQDEATSFRNCSRNTCSLGCKTSAIHHASTARSLDTRPGCHAERHDVGAAEWKARLPALGQGQPFAPRLAVASSAGSGPGDQHAAAEGSGAFGIDTRARGLRHGRAKVAKARRACQAGALIIGEAQAVGDRASSGTSTASAGEPQHRIRLAAMPPPGQPACAATSAGVPSPAPRAAAHSRASTAPAPPARRHQQAQQLSAHALG